MTERLLKIHEMLGDAKLTHLLITDVVDVAYVSGFVASNAALLISKRSSRLFTDFRYETAVTAFCAAHPEWRYVKITSSLAEAIGRHVPAASRVGFQSDHCTVDEYKKFRHHFKDSRLVSCSNRINDLLMVKTTAEINCMTKAAAIADKAFDRLISDGTLKKGVTEISVARRLEALCTEFGSEKPSFDTIVLFGANAALPHGKPGATTLKKGDFILIDFGCTLGGFASDMTRTLVFGKATEKQREIYHIVKDAQEFACAGAQAGMTGQEIDALARTMISKAGYAKEFGHSLGHGVGRRIHEAPKVGSHTVQKLPAQTVITIEPGIYLPDFGGVRIEDMAVLTSSGCMLLSHSIKELVEL